MKKETKKKIRRAIGITVAVLVVAGLAAMPLLVKKEPEAAEGPQASILSGTAKVQTVDQRLLGGGTLEPQAAETVTIPQAVKLTKLLVKNGDIVSAGDGIAEVDKVSVMEAISLVQETLEWYSEEIEAAGDSTTNQKMQAKAGGIVKVVYAEAGDSVETVMLENGALVILSLDGRMSVTFQTEEEAPSGGDEVTVVLSDGTEVIGTVESSLKGTVKLLVEDKNYTQGQEVTVLWQDAQIGTGTLEINSPWKVTGYAGTVETVSVKSGDQVDAGDVLMKLSDTGHTATWQQLVDQRSQYEKMMLELFQMYQTGLVTAPCDGAISGLDEKGSQMLKINQLAGAPNGDDTMTYINYIGKVAAVGQNGWAVLRNPIPVEIEDYRFLTGVNTDTTLMTEVAVYIPGETVAPLYELVEGQWVQAELTTVQAEDVILFAGDSEGNFVWLVRVKKAETQQPGEGNQRPGQGQQPSGGQGSQFPSGGNMPNFSGGNFQQQEEEEFQAYSLTTAEIASITAQTTMTLQIQVDERDILKLQEGITAQVTIDALTGQVFTGTITDIGTSGTDNGGSSKFTVELTMDRAEDMLAGMHATATIQLDSVESVVTVPVAALAEEGSKTVIYTGYDEQNKTLINPIEVTAGFSDGETVEIISGLNEGAIYYYSYYDTLIISDTPEFGGNQFFGR